MRKQYADNSTKVYVKGSSYLSRRRGVESAIATLLDMTCLLVMVDAATNKLCIGVSVVEIVDLLREHP